MGTGKISLAPLLGLGSCHLRAAQKGAGNVLLAPEEDPRFPTHWILGLKAEGEGRWQRGQQAKATPFRGAFCYALSKFVLGGPVFSQATLVHPDSCPQLRPVHHQRWVGEVWKLRDKG